MPRKPNPQTTIAELNQRLTPEQRKLLRTASDARQREMTQNVAMAAVTRLAVRDALNEGVPAKLLANELKISVPRVYQLRSEVVD